MELQGAVENFEGAMKHCVNIIEVHRGYGTGGGGRRYREVSLDRAVVVLAVAAWQAAVQDITLGIVETAAPSAAKARKRARYLAKCGQVFDGVQKLATPNAQNTRRLMMSAGFDPRPLWTWTIAGGRGRQRVTWTPAMVDGRLDEWLQVRHAIAHGHDELPVVQALESVRLDGATSDPTIRLTDAETCVSFLRRLVRLTSNGAAAHVGTSIVYPATS